MQNDETTLRFIFSLTLPLLPSIVLFTFLPTIITTAKNNNLITTSNNLHILHTLQRTQHHHHHQLSYDCTIQLKTVFIYQSRTQLWFKIKFSYMNLITIWYQSTNPTPPPTTTTTSFNTTSTDPTTPPQRN